MALGVYFGETSTGAKVFEYLDQIQEAVNNSCIYMKGLSKDEFLADKLTQQAIFMNLIIIAESAMLLVMRYPELVELYPDIQWYNMQRSLTCTEQGDFNHPDIDTMWDIVQIEMQNFLYQQFPDVRKDLPRKFKPEVEIHNQNSTKTDLKNRLPSHLPHH